MQYYRKSENLSKPVYYQRQRTLLPEETVIEYKFFNARCENK